MINKHLPPTQVLSVSIFKRLLKTVEPLSCFVIKITHLDIECFFVELKNKDKILLGILIKRRC